MSGVDRITDSLHVANAQAVRELPDDHDYDEIVTLGYWADHGYDRPEQSSTGDRFVFPDSADHDYAAFEAAVEHVINAVNDGDSVLVHCQAGVSRSPGVCSVALTELEGISLDDALNRVQDARPIAGPAPSIRDSMERYADDEVSQPLPERYREDEQDINLRLGDLEPPSNS